MGWPSDDNYIELSWGGRRIFRIGPKGVGIILVAEILIVGAAVASIIWGGLKLSGTI